MEPRVSFITLGVADLDRATRFYADVLKLPRIPMPDDAGVSFFEMGKTWLSLFPREELAKDAGVPNAGSGFAGFSRKLTMRACSSIFMTPKLRACDSGTSMQPTVMSAPFSTCAAIIGP